MTSNSTDQDTPLYEQIQELALEIPNTTDRAEAVVKLQKLVVLVKLEARDFQHERITKLKNISLEEAKKLSYKADIAASNHCECYAKGYLDGVSRAINVLLSRQE